MVTTKASWAALGVAVALLSGCVTTQSSLVRSAERLEDNALELQSDARSGAGDRYYRDAQEFAAEARDFRRTIEDRDADRGDIDAAFRDLSRRYHALRDEAARSGSRDAQMDFESVTEAYLDVEREMRRHEGGRDRVAAD